jgi:multicomponent Na+:H+ antiporter subunit D
VGRFTGFGRAMPWTMAAFTLSALSMIGVPPTAGFFSKWYLLLGGIDSGNWLFVAAILLSSLLTAVYFFRVLEQVYAAHARGNNAPAEASDPPPSMLFPILVLAAGVLILGLFNTLIVTRVLDPIVAPLRALES